MRASINYFKGIVGMTIVAAYQYEEDLYLDTDRGLLRLHPYGDCCSHCYIQHISGSSALIGKVDRIEDITSEPTAAEKWNQDVLDGWGHRLYIQGKGICDIEMRLSHNGYYGGSLEVEEVSALPRDAKPLKDF